MNFIEFYNSHKNGWWSLEELPKEIRKDLLERLSRNDKKIGIFVYHSHTGNPLVFQGMKCGYYVRNKNIFSWKHNKVYKHN